jgi:hypothetical protein
MITSTSFPPLGGQPSAARNRAAGNANIIGTERKLYPISDYTAMS